MATNKYRVEYGIMRPDADEILGVHVERASIIVKAQHELEAIIFAMTYLSEQAAQNGYWPEVEELKEIEYYDDDGKCVEVNTLFTAKRCEI